MVSVIEGFHCIHYTKIIQTTSIHNVLSVASQLAPA